MRHTRRWIAAGVLVLELAVLVLALTLPAFQVRTVAVSGNRLLSSAALLRAAAVPASSIFTIDGGSVRARLLALPWVQDATVTTELPGTVRIAVAERPPVLRVRAGSGDVLVAANGAVLPAGAAPSAAAQPAAVLVDDRVGSPPPLDPALLGILGTTAQRFPGVFGCSVAAFQWGSDGVLAIWASSGWRAVLGHVDTDAAIAAVPAQLSALAALKGQLDFAHPGFGYVDLDNLAGPAVGGSPGLPAEIQAASRIATEPGPYAPATVAPPVSTPSPTPSPSPALSPGASPPASPPVSPPPTHAPA